jgi:hypothetical protein
VARILTAIPRNRSGATIKLGLPNSS